MVEEVWQGNPQGKVQSTAYVMLEKWLWAENMQTRFSQGTQQEAETARAVHVLSEQNRIESAAVGLP